MKTVKELLDNIEPLKTIMNEKMPIATSYKLGKFMKECEDVLSIFDEHKKELFEKYGKPDGENIQIDKENVPAFQEALEGYLNESIEIETPTVTLSDLGDINIEPAIIGSLDWLIQE